MLAVSYPAPIELAMTPLELALLRDRRRRLLAQATGRVLELGGSGGVNLDHYPASDVSEVVVVGSGSARERVERAAARVAVPVRLQDPDEVVGVFDTIVAIFTLSGRPDLDAELHGLAGVLDPAGQLLFLDHSARRPSSLTAELRRPFWRVVGAGFVPGRNLPDALRRSGFVVLSLDRFGLPTLTWPLRSCVAGMARRQRPGGVRRAKSGAV
jgi:SAM-dependent methyltransferase